jgi:hypothetical protein
MCSESTIVMFFVVMATGVVYINWDGLEEFQTLTWWRAYFNIWCKGIAYIAPKLISILLEVCLWAIVGIVKALIILFGQISQLQGAMASARGVEDHSENPNSELRRWLVLAIGTVLGLVFAFVSAMLLWMAIDLLPYVVEFVVSMWRILYWYVAYATRWFGINLARCLPIIKRVAHNCLHFLKQLCSVVRCNRLPYGPLNEGQSRSQFLWQHIDALDYPWKYTKLFQDVYCEGHLYGTYIIGVEVPASAIREAQRLSASMDIGPYDGIPRFRSPRVFRWALYFALLFRMCYVGQRTTHAYKSTKFMRETAAMVQFKLFYGGPPVDNAVNRAAAAVRIRDILYDHKNMSQRDVVRASYIIQELVFMDNKFRAEAVNLRNEREEDQLDIELTMLHRSSFTARLKKLWIYVLTHLPYCWRYERVTVARG